MRPHHLPVRRPAAEALIVVALAACGLLIVTAILFVLGGPDVGLAFGAAVLVTGGVAALTGLQRRPPEDPEWVSFEREFWAYVREEQEHGHGAGQAP